MSYTVVRYNKAGGKHIYMGNFASRDAAKLQIMTIFATDIKHDIILSRKVVSDPNISRYIHMRMPPLKDVDFDDIKNLRAYHNHLFTIANSSEFSAYLYKLCDSYIEDDGKVIIGDIVYMLA